MNEGEDSHEDSNQHAGKDKIEGNHNDQRNNTKGKEVVQIQPTKVASNSSPKHEGQNQKPNNQKNNDKPLTQTNSNPKQSNIEQKMTQTKTQTQYMPLPKAKTIENHLAFLIKPSTIDNKIKNPCALTWHHPLILP
ncbi:hypothetical protein S245_069296 [Arachis hypogaea]